MPIVTDSASDAPLAATPSGVDTEAWAAACAEVRSYCGWHIAPTVTQSVTVNGPGGAAVLLPTLRLQNLTSITNDGTTVADPEWSENGVVRGWWTSRLRGVVADMTHGYDTCPADLLAVIKAMAARLEANPENAQRVQRGPFADQYESGTGFTASEKATLDRYRLPARP